MAPIRWQPDRLPSPPPWNVPPTSTAIGRGMAGRCPSCGKGHVFNGFIRVVTECDNCAAPLGSARADDAPPYFTILIVGHIIVPMILIWQRMSDPPTWLMSVVFVPMTIVLSVALMRPVKGAVVGLMLSLNMLKTEPDTA